MWPIALLVYAQFAFALDPNQNITQYGHTIWRSETGLPHNTVKPIIQTQDGYVWFGTPAGLVRFDGARFKLLPLREVAGNSGNDVHALVAAHDGSLWIGFSDGLVHYKGGVFKSYGTKDGLVVGVVFALAEDREGNLWIGTTRGLSCWNGTNFRTYTTKDGLPSNDVRAISVGPTGEVWMGTMGGAARYRAGKFVSYTTLDGLPSDYVRAILVDHAGRVWVGTPDGLSRLENDRFVDVAITPALKLVRVIAEDRDRNIWIGAVDRGLIRYRDGQISTYNALQGLSSDMVLSIFEDREGGLWVGTDSGGLNRFYAAPLTNYTSFDGLADNVAWSVTQDRSGDLWIGTNKGLSRYHQGRFRNYSRKDGLNADIVLSTLADRDGNIWIGTPDGLNVFRNGRFLDYGRRYGVARSVILALYEDRQGDVWVACRNRLHQFRKGKHIRAFSGLSQNYLRAIAEDQRGDLWFGTNGDGVFRLSQGKLDHYTVASGLSSDLVLTIYSGKEGAVWIGTDGGGITRFKDSRFTRYDTTNGLFDDAANQFLEDDLGRFWISSSRGIYSVYQTELNELAEGKRKSVTSIPYGAQEGLRNTVTSNGVQPAGWKASDGKLWFPTTGGVVVVDPHNMHSAGAQSSAIIEEVTANSQTVSRPALVQVQPGEGRLEFHYTAFNYNSPNRIRFRYKLEGFDKSWIEAQDRRTAFYTNIRPGKYTFRVMAANSDGPWNDSGAPASLYLRPHFYQTAWFIALCLVGILGLAFQLGKSQRKKVHRREHELTLVRNALHQKEQADRLQDALYRISAATSSIVSLEQIYPAVHDILQELMDAPGYCVALFDEITDSISFPFCADQQQTSPATRKRGMQLIDYVLRTGVPLVATPDRLAELAAQGEIQSGETLHRNWAGVPLQSVRRSIGVLAAYSDNPSLQYGSRERDILTFVARQVVSAIEKARREDALRQSQKMEAIGRLAGGVAHDFNNLLTVITGYSEVVLENFTPEDRRRTSIQEIRKAADRAASLTRQLLAFSRQQMLQPKFLNLNQILSNLQPMLSRLLGEAIQIKMTLAPDLGAVRADRSQIEQVMLNLAVNARDAMPQGGTLTLETRNLDLDEAYARSHVGVQAGPHVILVVSDTGVGMDSLTLDHIFDPFFTDKGLGRGTGLGLATVYGIVQQSGGHVAVRSERDRGTTFDIYLPAVEAAALQELHDSEFGTPAPTGHETILLIEDEEAVRTLTTHILQSFGYSVLTAGTAEQARRSIAENCARVDVVLTDIVLPDANGIQLARDLSLSCPQAKIIFMSGYSADVITKSGFAEQFHFIQKPFTPRFLGSKLRDVLDGVIRDDSLRSDVA